eukprot:8730376-Pyramimonas_sp.AAC.1
MVNPHAIETGTVFVQCSDCLVQHNIVDNLNLLNDMEVCVCVASAHPVAIPRAFPTTVHYEEHPQMLASGHWPASRMTLA